VDREQSGPVGLGLGLELPLPLGLEGEIVVADELLKLNGTAMAVVHADSSLVEAREGRSGSHPEPPSADSALVPEGATSKEGQSSTYLRYVNSEATPHPPGAKATLDKGEDVYFQGLRQMTNVSRQYYEKELGAGLGPNPAGAASQFGYTEPLRRFIQREGWEPQANEIPNTMPSWIPGDDYFINFRVGDPYVKIGDGYARLPGAGYEALHPELEGVDPEYYPEINKLAILADVAPYSREYATFKTIVGRMAQNDTATAIEYAKILERVRQTRESVVKTSERRFIASVEEVEGTTESADARGSSAAKSRLDLGTPHPPPACPLSTSLPSTHSVPVEFPVFTQLYRR
jgi:hypothetical protein